MEITVIRHPTQATTSNLAALARPIPPAAAAVIAARLGSSSFRVFTVSHAVTGNNQPAPISSVPRI